jgi:subtilisin family serine protease
MRKPAVLVSALSFVALMAPDAASQKEIRATLAHRRSMEVLELHPSLEYDPTTILVRFHASTPDGERDELARAVRGFRLRSLGAVPGLELVGVGIDVDRAVEALAPFVEYAERNWIVRGSQTIPNDTYFNLEWGLHNTGQVIQGQTGIADADIDCPEAWDISTGSASFVIADIDTGMQWTHPDLDGNVWSNPGEIAGNGVDDDGNGYVDDVRGWDFYSVDNNPDDEDGHGTHTAGTIGAEGNNGIGVAGVNWQCKLMPLRFLGPFGGSTSDAILAVNYAANKGVRVSNNSWGGGGFSQGLYDAINAAKAVNHVFVAAAGNNGSNNDSSPFYPASYNLTNLISVAATDNRDNRASFSNYGAVSVDLGAPGVNVASTYSASGYAYLSGTSMATPHVTGVVALVEALNPSWTYQQVITRILSTVRPAASMSGVTATGGILNALAAVSGGGGDTTPPAAPTGLVATGGNGSVSLDWNDNTEPDLAGYRVYRSTTSGSGYVEISTGLVIASAYLDTSVSNGTTYYYVVRAADTSGNLSGNSNEASGTPNGGGSQVLFSDGFESGNFTAGGWTRQNNDSLVSSAAARTGSFGARIRRTSWIQRSVSTTGFTTVVLRYSRRTTGLDAGENLFVEWSTNGTAWNAVETTASTSWADQTFTLPGTAGNNAGFRIRFRTNGGQPSERADVDNVEVSGTP